jgi:hypothetical protein
VRALPVFAHHELQRVGEGAHGGAPKVLPRDTSGWRESNPRNQLGRLELYH